jgi:hypothetical protein
MESNDNGGEGEGGVRNYATEMERKIEEKRNYHASVNMQNQFL